ncbi:MAG: HTH domain-containing protein, partial [Eubacteriales bacterium]|nr:HTH domain-containing protein [Eubacteriales bacterium]
MFPYNRLNKIFDYIYKEKIIPIENLCNLLNITDRTIRTDIQTINTILQNNGATIKLKRKCGYYIEILDNEKFNIFLEKLSHQNKSSLELDSSKERTKYLLNILLYSNDYISLDTLCEQIFVSTNTLKNYIKSLNNIFLKYNLEIINKSNLGIKIIGSEDNKRKCLMDNILSKDFQNYITSFTKEEYSLFKDIDLDKLKSIIYKKLKNANIQINDFNFKNLIIHFALMISR